MILKKQKLTVPILIAHFTLQKGAVLKMQFGLMNQKIFFGWVQILI